MKHTISSAEWEIVKILWGNKPLYLSEITKEIQKGNNWSSNTVRTLLVRLIEKSVVGCDKSAGRFKYFSILKENETKKDFAVDFIEKYFAGSIPEFIDLLNKDGRINPFEKQEILKILEKE